MQFGRRHLWVAAIAAAAIPLTLGLGLHRSHAADHLDPPGRVDPDPSHAGAMADRPADIADLFVWYAGTGTSQTFTTILTYDGPNAPMAGQHIPCDRDALYSINIDNTNDAMPEYTINVRFGQDDTSNHNCFVSASGIPGVSATVVGRAEHNVAIPGGGMLFAGLRDDAFFFDLQGFRDTLAAGRLINPSTNQPYMQNDRDFFAGKNTPAIVIECPLGAIRPTGTNPIRVWATSARHPAG